MARISEIKMQIRIAWWLKWYLLGVRLTMELTGCDPDWRKVDFWIGRAVTLKPMNEKASGR